MLLRNRRPVSDAESGVDTAKPFERVVLYTGKGCHLCEEAKATLVKYGRHLPEIEEVDINSDPELKERFKTCIPVVEIDGRIRFRGEVNEILLRRLLEGKRARK